MSNSVLSARRRSNVEEVRKERFKGPVLDELVALFIEPKLHGSQNVTKSGCNENQEDLNHTQKDVLPKSLALHRANLTQQLYNCSTVNTPFWKRGHEP